MALSVSGFPEPPRPPANSNEVFTGESGQDGPNKAGLMNSPRLRGLFGGGSTPSKRPESKHPTPASKSDVDVEAFQTTTPAVTPPTTPSISFATTAFPPVPQEEYELGLQLPMTVPLDPPSVHTGKRAQLPPLPRKTTASPVRLGPSLTRLDIGAGLRSTPTTHPHSKPPPPSVVVEEWGVSMSSGAPRPLPSVPGIAPEQMKSSSSPPSSSIAGPSRPTKVASPVAGPSRHANAIAGPSKHANAVAGPSKYPSDLSSPSSSSPLSSISAGESPSSKILITEPTPARTHKQNAPSLSMRFQPLVVDPSGSPSADPSSPANASLNTTVLSPVRPLPRVPPVTTAPPTTIRIAAPVPTRYLPPPAKVKRPKTSPSSINGFAPPVLTANVRAAFTTIPNSWASRPVDLNAQRPTSPSVRPPVLKYPRARSHSRPRRDRSLDSIYARTTSPIRAPSPATMSTPTHGTRAIRTLPSPTLLGARPLPRKSPTVDSIPKKLPTIRTSSIKPAMTARSAPILSPGARRPPPSPPTGPVPRVKSPTTYSPGSRPHTPSTDTSRRVQQVPIPLPPPPLPPIVTDARSMPKDDAVSIDTLMHRHPTDAFADSESLLHPKPSPIEPNTTESPVEVFLDNQDYSTLSRSPSPIRYARPDSRGNLSDSTDDEALPSDSESSSSRGSSRARRRRTQLRAYRKSYRPQPGSSPPHIPFRSPSPPPQRSIESEKEKEEKKEKKAKKKPGRSYFGGGDSRTSVTGSAPPTRASSPERKSRSRQPRRLAEAMSIALGGARSSASAGAAAGGEVAFPVEMEVLDISLPAEGSSMSGSSSNVASVEEAPFMWVSSSKPLVPPAPVMPESLPHRRVNSLGFGGGGEQGHGAACGLRPLTTTITSTVSVTGSRPPSTLSTPFSAFSRSSKKKRTNSVPMTNEFSYEQMGGEQGAKHSESPDEAVVVTTRRIVRGVDYVGDVWEQEKETAVSEVIPHLRTLKAHKG